MEIKHEMPETKICIVTRTYSQPSAFLHWHQNYEICQVVHKKCVFLVNGAFIEAEEGDIVIIGESVVHRFMAQEETRVRILQFSLKVLTEAGIPIKRLKVHISKEEIGRIEKLEQKIKMFFEIIEAEGCTVVDGQNYLQQCTVAALYCLLTCHFVEENRSILNKEQHEFLKIIEYIKGHFEEDINVNTLAERLFMFRGRLSSIFNKYSGMGLNEYIYSLRIKKANDLMNQGYSVTDAALQSGFQSIRTFNNIYKKVCGMTPSDYKKRFSREYNIKL